MTPAQMKRIRTRLGISQTQLARTMGVTPGTIANWENGRQPVATSRKRWISRYFKKHGAFVKDNCIVYIKKQAA